MRLASPLFRVLSSLLLVGLFLTLVAAPRRASAQQPTAPDLALSQLTVTTPHRADGQEAALLTVTLRDSAGTPIVGQSVRLLVTGGTHTLSGATAPSDASGVVTATLTSTQPGIRVVQALVAVGSTTHVLKQRPLIHFEGAQVSGTVYLDADRDGSQDGGEAGRAGIPLRLNGPSGQAWRTITSPTGSYTFTALSAGTYSLQLLHGADYLPVGAQPLTLTAFEARAHSPIALQAAGTVRGLLWHDLDEDGLPDADEPGRAGGTVEASGSAGLFEATSTSTGRYTLYLPASLPPAPLNFTLNAGMSALEGLAEGRFPNATFDEGGSLLPAIPALEGHNDGGSFLPATTYPQNYNLESGTLADTGWTSNATLFGISNEQPHAGNYAYIEGGTKSLTTPAFEVPQEAQAIRWWWRTNGITDAPTKVEVVNVATGVATTLMTHGPTNSYNETIYDIPWSEVVRNISAFRGQTIQLRFTMGHYFYTQAMHIDDIRLSVELPGWNVLAAGNTFGVSAVQPHAGNYAYVRGAAASLLTPAFEVPQEAQAIRWWWRTNGITDAPTKVEVVNVATGAATTLMTYGPSNSYTENIHAIPWSEVVQNISAFRGQTIQLRFTMGHYFYTQGMHIDDIRLSVELPGWDVLAAGNTFGVSSTQPHDGPYGSIRGAAASMVTPAFVVPEEAQAIRWWWRTNGLIGAPTKVEVVNVATGAATTLLTHGPSNTYTEDIYAIPWSEVVQNISAFRGQTIQLRFTMGHYYYTQAMHIDDIRLTMELPGWETSSAGHVFGVSELLPHDGPYAYLQGAGRSMTTVPFAVPTDTQTLRWWWRTNGISGAPTQVHVVDTETGSSSLLLQDSATYTQDVHDAPWREMSASLTAYQGQHIQLRFTTGFYFLTQAVQVDDIQLLPGPSASAYTVSSEPPNGQVATTDTAVAVQVQGGQVQSVDFGAFPTTPLTPTPTPGPSATPTLTPLPTLTPSVTPSPTPAVVLHAEISPSTAFAMEQSFSLVVEARNGQGQRLTTYRGAIDILPSSETTGLALVPNADYTFTAQDAGRHEFANFAFNVAGSQQVALIDVNETSLSATSNTVTVQEVSLHVAVTAPRTGFAGEAIHTVVVEARDSAGNLVPGYRGSVAFSTTAGQQGLPTGGVGNSPYAFTAADAGRHEWTGIVFNTPGEHTLTASDGARQGTSSAFTVSPVTLSVAVSPSTMFANEPVTVTVEARDEAGSLVPGYRGAVAFSTTAGQQGLPTGGLTSPPYAFTAADGGRHVWTGVTFGAAGAHTLTVGDGTRQANTSMTVQQVVLSVTVSPSPVFANEPVAVTVEARDEAGNLVPAYGGWVTFSTTGGQSGLPTGGLGNPPYSFTAADGGRHVWTTVTFSNGGEHTLTVTDGTRQASTTLTVQDVTLSVAVSPTTIYAGDASLSVVVEARNSAGELVPSYRGGIEFTDTGEASGLPDNLFMADYTFTASDAGRHIWQGIAFAEAGTQTISVSDGVRQVTSNPVTVAEVTLSVVVSPTTLFAGDPSLSVVVEARDAAGALVPSYQGRIEFTDTGGASGLPDTLFMPDYTFTPQDAGRHVWEGIAFAQAGSQTISVNDSVRQATSNAVTVREVYLSAVLSPTVIYAGVPELALTVEVRDEFGNLVPSYRGGIEFEPTGPARGYEDRLFQQDYFFTAEDAGRHIWSQVGFHHDGTHTITLSDATRVITTNAVTVKPITLSASITPTQVIEGDSVTVTLSVLDPATGAPVPGYQGLVHLSNTLPISVEWPYQFQPVLPVAGEVISPSVVIGEFRTRGPEGGKDEFIELFNRSEEVVDLSGWQIAASEALSTTGSPRLTLGAGTTLGPGCRFLATYAGTGGYSGLVEGDQTYTVGLSDDGGLALLDAEGNVVDQVGLSSTTFYQEGVPLASLSADLDQSYERHSVGVNRQDTDNNAADFIYQSAGGPQNRASACTPAPSGGTGGSGGGGGSSTGANHRSFYFGGEYGGVAHGPDSLLFYDWHSPDYQAAPISVLVTEPPAPTPAPQEPLSNNPYEVPNALATPTPMPYVWSYPTGAFDAALGSNTWQSYPLEDPTPPHTNMVPATPGARYFVQGRAHRGMDFWWSTYYTCVWIGWENPITWRRDSGGWLLKMPYHDAFAFRVVNTGCSWPISHAGSSLQLGLSEPAPAETEGLHVTLHAGGNSWGLADFGAAAPDDSHECGATETPLAVADPIDTRTGEFYLHEQDLGLETGCQGIDLRFERAYSTQTILGGSLGPGWVHNYEQRVIPVGGNFVALQRPRGSLLLFEDVGGDIYAGKAGLSFSLVKRQGGGWALIHRTRQVDLFDAAGRLVVQQDPNGNRTWLTYQPYGRNGTSGTRLARVDAPGGRYLWFGYDYYYPTRLRQISDHTGRIVRYNYALSDYGPFLSEVIDVRGGTSHYAYQNWRLIAKDDAAGSRIFTNEYDARGRVIHQTNSRGEDATLSYLVDTGGITTTVQMQTGAQTIHVYSTDGLLREVIDALGGSTYYRDYHATRQPTEIEDALGNQTHITYNAQGLPTSVTDALAQQVQFEYNAWGNPTALEDTLGRRYTFTYEGANLVSITNPLSETVQLSHEAQGAWQGMLTTITNPAGEETHLTYNTAGDLSTVTDALDNLTQMEYDATGRPVTITDARGVSTTLTYDAADQVLQITDALSGTMSMEYDAAGNLVQMSDQIGTSQLITYSQSTLPIAVQDAAGGVVQIGYVAGRPVTMTDQLGQASYAEYDLADRVVAVTDPLGNTTRYGYDAVGNTTVITDANGHGLTITYDAIYRPIEVENALGQRLQYGYNAANNVIAITDTAGAAVHIEYDALGRPTVVTDQVGATTEYAYNALGLVETLTDGNGRVTQYDYDALGRLSEVIANYRPGFGALADTNVRTRYAYDPIGNLLTLTDTRGFVTSFEYDVMGRLASLTDPLERTMHYTYDERGLLSTWQKADETTLSYHYDTRGLLTSLVAPEQTTQYQHDALGRRTAMQDATGTTSYQYDAASRPLTITLSTGEAVGYGYDAVGNRTELRYPDGKTVQYGYDAANQLTTVTDWDNQLTTYEYDSTGRPSLVQLPNGVSTTLAYDGAGHLLSLQHQRGSELIGSYQYSYDATGRRTTAIEADRTITYTYDGLYRLTGADESTGDSYQYAYDAAGNRLWKIEPTGVQTATFDAANQLATLNGLPVQYDANGNLLDDGMSSYQYDSFDQLIAVTSGITTTTFGYTGEGDRLWQATNGLTTTFTLDLSTALTQVLAQQGSGSISYLPGIGQEIDGAWLYFHGDALGNVRHLTNSSGITLMTSRYSPFGERIQSSGILPFFGFTGESQDAASDLTYLRARYYHPALGRFLTQDALIPEWTNGQAWNSYTYVYNDVVNWTDPTGFDRQQPSQVPSDNNLWGGLQQGVQNGLHFGCSCEESNSGGVAAFLSSLTHWASGAYWGLYYESQDRLWGDLKKSIFVKQVTEPVERVIREEIPRYSARQLAKFPASTRLMLKNLKPRVTVETKISMGTRVFEYNPNYTPRLQRVFGFLNKAWSAGAMGAFFQGLSDVWDCSLSGPEQFLRMGVVGFEGFAVATVAGLVAVPGVVGFAGAAFIIIAATWAWSVVNNHYIFPWISEQF